MKNPTTYRFFLPSNFALDPNELMIGRKTNPEIFHQLNSVLRIKVGDRIIILNNNPEKLEYHYQLVDQTKTDFRFQGTGSSVNLNELSYDLILAVSLPAKPDTLSTIIQKATETGARKIILLKTEFTQLRHQPNLERLNKIVVEAAEQSERASLPQIIDQTGSSFEDFLKTTANLFVALERDYFPPVDLAQTLKSKPNPLTILIGPEGGFSESEKKFFYQVGLPCFTLGKTVLRMETAVVSALAIFKFLLG